MLLHIERILTTLILYLNQPTKFHLIQNLLELILKDFNHYWFTFLWEKDSVLQSVMLKLRILPRTDFFSSDIEHQRLHWVMYKKQIFTLCLSHLVLFCFCSLYQDNQLSLCWVIWFSLPCLLILLWLFYYIHIL